MPVCYRLVLSSRHMCFRSSYLPTCKKRDGDKALPSLISLLPSKLQFKFDAYYYHEQLHLLHICIHRQYVYFKMFLNFK